MQICLLQQLDSRAAQRLYVDYVQHHWVDHWFIAGFREWPKSRGPKSKEPFSLGDIDSGPLVLGIGPTATGVGIGAAKAVSDTKRVSTLKVPTLLLTGSKTSSPQLKLAINDLMQSLPNRSLVVFEGQQHNAMDTIPQQFASTVINFLQSTNSNKPIDQLE